MTYRTRILEVTDPPGQSEAVAQAARLIRRGEVVAFPTETVYGLGGDATNPDAIARIYQIKNRPADNPLIVHIDEPSRIREYCREAGPYLDRLAAAFWPGPLTVVLAAGPLVRDTVCRGLETVAIRVPEHPVARALIREAGTGLAAPSANLSGKPSPTTARHVYDDLAGRIPLILDGGPCRVGLESTVLDLSGERPTILRPGTISGRALAAVLGRSVVDAGHEAQLKSSPGTRYRHYRPDDDLYLVGRAVSGPAFQRLIAFLAETGKTGYFGERVLSLTGPFADRICQVDIRAELLPVSLYSLLRDAGRLQTRGGVVMDLPDTSEGVSSLSDRLVKASSRTLLNDTEIARFLEEADPGLLKNGA